MYIKSRHTKGDTGKSSVTLFGLSVTWNWYKPNALTCVPYKKSGYIIILSKIWNKYVWESVGQICTSNKSKEHNTPFVQTRRYSNTHGVYIFVLNCV